MLPSGGHICNAGSVKISGGTTDRVVIKFVVIDGAQQ